MVRVSSRYLEGHGFDSRWGLRKFFFWVVSRVENASSLFTLYPSHQSIYHLFHLLFRHVEPCSMAGHLSLILEPSIWPCSPQVSHSSVVRASNRYLEGHGFNSRWGLRKNSEYFDLRTLLHYLHFIQVTNPFITFLQF